MIGAVVVLAAGAARRFGSDKRLFEIDGAPMLRTTVERYAASFDHVYVVIRPDEAAVRALLEPLPVTIVEAADAHLGMAESLKAGCRALPAEIDYAFVGLADMPYVTADTLRLLDRRMQQATVSAIVRPRFAGRPGHPVGFGRDHFAEILAGSGDEGAREVVRRHRSAVIQVDVQDDGVLRDIDVPPT